LRNYIQEFEMESNRIYLGAAAEADSSSLPTHRSPGSEAVATVGYLGAAAEADSSSLPTHRSPGSEAVATVRKKRAIHNAAKVQKIREYLDLSDETQDDFAHRAGCGLRTIGKLLKDGRASQRTWDKVEAAMRDKPSSV
jgi:hypothetical protein